MISRPNKRTSNVSIIAATPFTIGTLLTSIIECQSNRSGSHVPLSLDADWNDKSADVNKVPICEHQKAPILRCSATAPTAWIGASDAYDCTSGWTRRQMAVGVA